ncbi:MAG: (d)CMP kinase [Erysipelotrichia bacterium]|nr:(d)CMP kinase [Erysipelotrichia bacterium]NCC54872.1 (d)CMP kinase [Erysipelotrichia bacterium]
MKINIAIDGPSAAGKSTIAKLLAAKLGYVHLDTGAMYRCCAYQVFSQQIDMEDEQALHKMMENIKISFDDMNHVFIDGKDVSKQIRTNENGMRTSKLSQKKVVREKLVDLQREIAKDKGYILDGRDIGTVVLKDAELKIYLVASVESRAKRRFDELSAKGMNPQFDVIAQDLKQRDLQDMTRIESPLKKAEDAIEVDTSNMSIEEVCDTIMKLIVKVVGK